jgi:hypothetical protein
MARHRKAGQITRHQMPREILRLAQRSLRMTEREFRYSCWGSLRMTERRVFFGVILSAAKDLAAAVFAAVMVVPGRFRQMARYGKARQITRHKMPREILRLAHRSLRMTESELHYSCCAAQDNPRRELRRREFCSAEQPCRINAGD